MKIGASSLAFLNCPPENAIRRIHEMGFEAWEILLEGKHVKKDYSDIKELADSYGITMFVHAPFSDLNLASLNEAIREESLSQIFESIKVADFLNANLINIHPGRLSPLGMFFLDKARQNNIESLKKIADFASDYNLTTCIENLPNHQGAICCTVEEVEQVLESEPRLKLTLDLGHANTCGNAIEYIKKLKPLIHHIHLHDNSGGEDTHSEIGSGTLDTKGVFSSLKGYKYFIILEAKDEGDAIRSKEKIEELI